MRIKVLYLLIFLIPVSCKTKQEPKVDSSKTQVKTNTGNHKKFVIDTTRDAEYMVDTYSNELYTVQAAGMVKNKTINKEVKEVANNIVVTHQKILNDLVALASKKKISLPSDLNMAQRNELKKLHDKNPGKIEMAFMEQMESGHKEDMELLEKISKESEDNDISTLAIVCLATVKSQYDEVVSVKERLEL